MADETNSPGGEAPPSRIRDARSDEKRRFADWVGELDRRRWFRPAVVIATAALAGLIIAPQLATQSYPTDPNLVGTPAVGNIKAPHDLEVIDEEATSQLREVAVAGVRRVYDFDTQLGDKRARGIEEAFTAMHGRVAAFLAEHPELAGERLTRVQAERLDEGLNQTLAPAVPEFEKTLGTTLKGEEAQLLATVRYDPEIGKVLGRAVREALVSPIVAERSVLEPDREKGFSVQNVPDDGRSMRTVTDIDAIADLETVRREFPSRVRQALADLPPATRDFVAAVGARLLEANLTSNRAAYELAREVARLAVKPVTINVKKGEMVIRDGERLTRRHLLIFRALSEAGGSTSIALAALGATLIVLLIIVVGMGWAPGRARRLVVSSRDLLFLASLFLTGLAAARIWSVVAAAVHDRFPKLPLDAFLFMLPLAAGAMITRLVLRANIAVWFAILASLVLGLMVDGDQPFALYAAVGSVLGATRLRTIAARSDLVRAGVVVGVGQAAAAFAIQLFAGQTSLVSYLATLPAAFAGGVLAGLATLALAPVVEAVFGYSTDLKLLELANLNHPALKELIVQAPGSYHHSVIVGSLVEAAAEAIGANPLLARVMAYYHDLGKGCNPAYFIENQRSGQNPHDKLKASMSAMIIRRHVTDGLEIAKRYRLGEPITAAIAEHHGTTLIHYFHHKAKEAAEDPESVSENDYRYPGRKPQSREAALVMLGDSVEAAARSVPDPNPARLAGVVHRIINLKFADEQLEECDITLKDLHTIAKSFSTVLASIYHRRPEYPELLKDITGGKKPNGDSDPKLLKRPKDVDSPPEDNRPDNLRRLGLS